MNGIAPLIIWFLFCGIFGLILWISMLNILDSKGEKVNYHFVTPVQLVKFWKVIKTESVKSLKKKYLFIFWTQIVLIPVFLFGGLLIILNMN